VSKSFGGDCTTSAIANRFRRIKSDAKLINDALANGIDPITLPTGGADFQVPPSRANKNQGQAAFSVRLYRISSFPFVMQKNTS
jgi:hypothetical protein